MPILSKLKASKDGLISLDQSDIIKVLKEHNSLLEDCSVKKKVYLQEIEKLTQEIKELDDIRFHTTEANEIRKQETNLREKYKESLSILCKKESIVNHIWFHYLQLPYDKKNILEKLYVEKLGWKTICEKEAITKVKVSAYRNEGLNQIIENVMHDISQLSMKTPK